MSRGAPRAKAIAHTSLGDKVYSAVRDLILGPAFGPGAKLNVERMARDLGVSRTPVWDALRRFEAEGLVETVPRRGVYVLNFTIEKVREVYVVREAVEGLAARLAAEQMDDATLGLLKRCLEKQVRCADAGDFATYSQADIEFHDRVAAASRNQTLVRILAAIFGQILVLRLKTLNLRDRIRSSIAEHHRIFEGLGARDGARAEAATREHIQMVLEDALKVLDSDDGSGGRGRGWEGAHRLQ